jgi:alanine racemase
MGRSLWAEIDLDALRANISFLTRTVYPAKFCAVVKADAYGHGARIIATSALEQGATYVAVATVEEGVALRDIGITAPILLLSEPDRDAVEDAVARDLTFSVYSVRTLIEIIASWERLSQSFPSMKVPRVHIDVDTGMHRIGTTPEGALELVSIATQGGLDVEGIFSHFAVADGGDDAREMTLRQIRRFERVLAQLAAIGITPRLVHLANSAGALGYPASRYDMVRVGMAMYGYPPSEHVAAPTLRPVLSLRARVSFVQSLPEGEAISYGLKRPLRRRSTIATVPAGYADGIPRLAFERGLEFLVHEQSVPLAGVVTMDQLMIDCGDLDVRIGDEVVLLGRQGRAVVDARDWARAALTTPYEIVTRIGPRVPRVAVASSNASSTHSGHG